MEKCKNDFYSIFHLEGVEFRFNVGIMVFYWKSKKIIDQKWHIFSSVLFSNKRKYTYFSSGLKINAFSTA